MPALITAKLANGKTIVGPVMGSGGMLGTGVLFVGHHARSAALNVLHNTQQRAAEGLKIRIFEPSPGHVAIYPDYSATADGPRVEIPLAGTTFTNTKKGDS